MSWQHWIAKICVLLPHMKEHFNNTWTSNNLSCASLLLSFLFFYLQFMNEVRQNGVLFCYKLKVSIALRLFRITLLLRHCLPVSIGIYSKVKRKTIKAKVVSRSAKSPTPEPVCIWMCSSLNMIDTNVYTLNTLRWLNCNNTVYWSSARSLKLNTFTLKWCNKRSNDEWRFLTEHYI